MTMRTLPPRVLAEWEKLFRAADAIESIGAALRHSDAAEGTSHQVPLKAHVIGGLHAAVEALGDYTMRRVDTLHDEMLRALHGPARQDDDASNDHPPNEVAAALEAAGWTKVGQRWVRLGTPDILKWQDAAARAIAAAERGHL